MRGLPSLAEFPVSFLLAVAIALGLLFGSFLNVVIHRLPRGENIAYPGSRCPGCGKPIAPRDNVPVLSWLVLRGRARCCGTRISPRYPLVEAIGGLLAWAVVTTVVLELPPETSIGHAVAVFALYLALGLGLVAVAFIDLDHMIVPDEITLGGAALAVASVPLRPEATFTDSLLGAAIGFAVVWVPLIWLYQLVRGRPGMGLGDAKLLLLAGAWFGWGGAVFALLAGAVQGTVVMLVLLLLGKKLEEPESVAEERKAMQEAIAHAEGEERAALERELALDPLGSEPEPGLASARMPFGPFLVLASLEYLVFGGVIRAWVTESLALP
jgi:leader peptidase (prepilin peptidase) / N-methyltransferase